VGFSGVKLGGGLGGGVLPAPEAQQAD